ncbi:hypothetical protein LQZ21_07885 [Treponema sp. TIM-1]|uniref:hypothetical protein n=1 Tax=Treponema sp. TIM-1 TaxID=2898417 RepID=UPI00397FBBE2
MALCGVALVTAGCALPLGEDYIITRDGSADITYITDYNLLGYVPIPKTGERPVIHVDNRGDLELTVVWKDNTGAAVPVPFDTFLGNMVYQAEISLTVKPGYGFYPATLFAYPPGKISSQTGDFGDPTRTVTVTYNNSDDADITFITDYNLQSYVPIPMAGEKPVRTINNRGDMTVEVDWEDPVNSGSFIPAGNYTFDIETVYRSKIRLKANSGYRFIAARNFEYPAGTVTEQPVSNSDPDERNLTWVTYIETKTPIVITDYNLTPYIPKPISGVTPVWSFAGPQYTGTVQWKNMETPAALTGPFQSGVAYTAEVTLTPAMGYTFTRAGQDTFVHTGAKTVTNPAGNGSVTIDFSVTASAGNPTIVYDTVLTDRLPKPIIGGTPVLGIAGAQYTGRVVWMPPHSTFQSGTVYKAVVTLNAAPGYTFTGIGQNVFFHDTASGIVTNPAGSGTVTINFPPAASATYLVIRSFGPVDDKDSALWLMRERRFDTDPLTIDLPGDFTEPVIPNSVVLTAADNSPTRVLINGHNRTLTVGDQGTLLSVGGGVTLTLQNITLQGYNANNAPLVTVASGGKLILGAGTTLTGNQTTADAGGVLVYSGGELVLNNGGVIEKMSAQWGGGVVVKRSGKFTMNGGTIKQNTAQGNDSGGGVYTIGTFLMTGGIIGGGDGDANRTAQGGNGVCVYSYGSLAMSGGTITGNITDTNDYGVCVYRDDAYPLFSMSGSAMVTQENKVFLSNAVGITIAGPLSSSDLVANLTKGEVIYGWDILISADSQSLIEEYRKFRYNGSTDHFTEPDAGIWSIYYKPY